MTSSFKDDEGDRSEDANPISRCESMSSIGSFKSIQVKDKNEEFKILEAEIISFCLSPGSGVTMEQSEFIIKRLTTLSSAFSALQGENEALRKLLTDSRQICKSIEKSVLTNLGEIKDTCVTYAAPKLTYAEKVKVKASRIPQSAVKCPRNVVTVFPVDDTSVANSEQTREKVMENIKPVTEKLKIRNLRKIKNNGVLIETETREDLTCILKSKKLEEAGLRVGLPNKKLPRIIIYDIPRDMKEDQLTEAIYMQNADLMDKVKFDKEIKLVFKTGDKKKEVVNWVAEVTPDLRKLLVSKSRVFIGWRSCNVRDFISITRCYKCQSFGHVAKYCSASCDTCGHCGADGHNYKDCPEKGKKEICVHCKRIGKPDNHSSRARECPVYKMALEQHINKIDYGEQN